MRPAATSSSRWRTETDKLITPPAPVGATEIGSGQQIESGVETIATVRAYADTSALIQQVQQPMTT